MVKKSDRKPKGGKHNPIVIVTCCVLIIVGMVAVSVFINSKNIESDTREKMTTYLQKKYKKDFIVENPNMGVKSFGMSGTWVAYAYADSNKNMTFEVTKSENKDHFTDQYTAKIWSQRETARLNKIAQQNASSSKWKVNASVEIYLAEPLSDTALPDNPKVEEIIKQESGPAYDVNLSYYELQNTSYDDVVRDMERITNSIMNEGIKNVNYKYSVTDNHGKTKKCETTYDRSFDYSYSNIKFCLSSTNQNKGE